MVTYMCVMKDARNNKETEDNMWRTAILVEWSRKVFERWNREMNEVEEKVICIFQVPQEEQTGSVMALKQKQTLCILGTGKRAA